MFFSTTRNICRNVLPSFLVSSHYPQRGTNDIPHRIKPTDYLNGVRGVASFVVFNAHFQGFFYTFLEFGYLSHPEHDHFFQLPIIRGFRSGSFMVSIFFILSGFVLSYKSVRQIRDGDPNLLNTLASSTFRRAPRLFLPCVVPIFVAGICVYNNLYDPVVINDPPYANYLGQAREDLHSLSGLINPFTWQNYSPPHLPHLWSLNLEFRGSMVVFLSLLCLSRTRTLLRMFLLSGFCYYILQRAQTEMFLFIAGILIAEIHHIKSDSKFRLEDLLGPSSKSKGRARMIRSISNLFWLLILMLSFFLGGWPRHDASISPGFVTLNQYTPSQFSNPYLVLGYWSGIAAVLFILACENLPLLQRPFTTRFARYLGDISFALYITHWTVLSTFGRYLTKKLMSGLGNYNLGFWIGVFIVTLAMIWVADVYWRLFDETSVQLSRWLWRKFSEDKLSEASKDPPAESQV